jgi:histidinol-phosphate aminotransferase
MKYRDLVRPGVLSLPVYEPGRPIEDVAREFGLDPNGVLKLASNENALGPSPKAVEAAAQAMRHAHLYPDGGSIALREKLAAVRGLKPEQIFVGTGSNEVMVLLAQALVGPGDEVIFGEYAFIVYKLAALLFGGKPVSVPMPNLAHDLDAMADAVTDRTKLIFLPSPNNPTGTVTDPDDLKAFIRGLPEHVVFCFDEAYAEFLDEPADLRPLIDEGHKVFCTRTFSKIYGLASLRVGYGYGDPELIRLLNQVRQPFNSTGIGQAAALAALDDHDFVTRSRESNRAGLKQLSEGFKRLGLGCPPSEANFLLMEVADSRKVFELLEARGIIVRPLHGYGLSQYLRVTVGTEVENHRLLEALEDILAGDQAVSLKGEKERR